MQLIRSDKLLDGLKGAYLFFDTNFLIGILKYPEIFLPFLGELRASSCVFLTIPQVQYEFTRGSDNLVVYKERLEHLRDLSISLYPIDQHLKDFSELALITHKVSKNASYTDYLLSVCICKFSNSYLISENWKDISSDLFDREYIFTVDTGKELRTYGVYKKSQVKLNAVAESIIPRKT